MPNRTKTHFSKESGTFDDGTYADVMHLSLCYQLADGMLGQPLYGFSTERLCRCKKK